MTPAHGNSTSTATTGFQRTSTVFIRRMKPEPAYVKPVLTEAERAMLQRLEGRNCGEDAGEATWE